MLFLQLLFLVDAARPSYIRLNFSTVFPWNVLDLIVTFGAFGTANEIGSDLLDFT